MIWICRIIYDSTLHKMQRIKKKKKNSQEKALKARNKIVMATRKNMASQFTSK